MKNIIVLLVLIIAASKVNASSLITIPNIPKPERAYFADFNNDGLQDIVVGNLADESVGVVLRDTQDKFSSAQWFDLEGDMVFSMDLAPGDFDQDGLQDVMVFNDKEALLFMKGNGDGTLEKYDAVMVFQNLEFFATKVDYNRDQKPDVLVLPPALGKKMGIILFTNESENGVLNLKKESFTLELKGVNNGENEVMEWEHAMLGQFDEDSHREILAINSRLNLAVILDRSHNGSWYLKRKFKTKSSPNLVSVYDINKDGIDDFVIGHYKDERSVVYSSDEEGDHTESYTINNGKMPSGYVFVESGNQVNLYVSNYFYGGVLQFKAMRSGRIAADPVYGEKLGERVAHLDGVIKEDGFELVASSFHDFELKVLRFRTPFRR